MHWEEPWVHEKHGGVRGGLGQGKERGAGCVGGKGRASVGQAGGNALGAGRAGRVEVVGVGAEKPPAWAVDHNEWGAMGPGAMGHEGHGCVRGKG